MRILIVLGLLGPLLSACLPTEVALSYALDPPLCSIDGKECIALRDRLRQFAIPSNAPAELLTASKNWNDFSAREIFVVTDDPTSEQLDVVFEMPPDFDAEVKESLVWPGILAYTQDYHGRCLIKVREDVADSVAVWTHELGHCIGFIHDRRDSSSIMYPEVRGAQSFNDDMLEVLDKFADL